jgi:steroid delta-isomerase-like uncharacterized protein
MSAQQNKETVLRFFNEVCNGRNLAAADQFFTPDSRYTDPSNPNVRPGPDGIRDVVGIYQGGFPDAYWHIDDVIAENDQVVVRWHGTGTHRNDLQGIPPTGNSVNVPGTWIFRLENGKVAESWDIWDTLVMLQQIGVVPAPEAV